MSEGRTNPDTHHSRSDVADTRSVDQSEIQIRIPYRVTVWFRQPAFSDPAGGLGIGSTGMRRPQTAP